MKRKIIYLISKLCGKCWHINKKYRQWIRDKTPMIQVNCKDCGKTLDIGCVYAPIDGWETNGWIDI